MFQFWNFRHILRKLYHFIKLKIIKCGVRKDWIKLRTYRSLKPKPSLIYYKIYWASGLKRRYHKNTINVSVLFLLNPNSALNNYLENFTVRSGLRPKPNFFQFVTNSLDPKFTEIYYFSFLIRGLMSQTIHSKNPLQ